MGTVAGWYACVGFALAQAMPTGPVAENESPSTLTKVTTSTLTSKASRKGLQEATRVVARRVRSLSSSRYEPKPDAWVGSWDIQVRLHLEMLAYFDRTKNYTQSELAFSLLDQAKARLGTPNAVQASAYLMHKAKRAEQANDLSQAVRFARQALRLSPDVLGLHWLYIRILIRYHPSQLRQIVSAGWRSIQAVGRSFRNQVFVVQLLVAVLWLSFSCSFTFFAGILLVRYGRYLGSDIADKSPVTTNRFLVVGLLAFLFIGLPILLQVGWPLSLMIALSLSLSYQRLWERVLSSIGILFFSMSPFVMAGAGPIFGFAGHKVDQLAMVLEDVVGENVESSIEQHANMHPEDGITQILLGHRAVGNNDYHRAIDYFESAAKIFSDSAYLINNIAVLKYRLGDTDVAESMLSRVVLRKPCPEVLYNLGLMHLSRGKLEQGQELMQRSVQAQYFWEQALSERAKDGTAENRLLMASSYHWLLWQALFQDPAGSVVQSPLWRKLTGSQYSVWFMPAWGCLAISLGLLGFLHPARSTACNKCGALMPVLGGDSQNCSQCQSVFSIAKAVSIGTRQAKELQVRRYTQRVLWLHRLVSFVPGASSLLRAEYILGAFGVVTCFCILLSVPSVLWTIGAYHAWHMPDDRRLYHWVVLLTWLLGGLMSAQALRKQGARLW